MLKKRLAKMGCCREVLSRKLSRKGSRRTSARSSNDAGKDRAKKISYTTSGERIQTVCSTESRLSEDQRLSSEVHRLSEDHRLCGEDQREMLTKTFQDEQGLNQIKERNQC